MNQHDAMASEPADLVQLLEQQRAFCTRLRHIGSRQRTLIAQDDPAPLLALLGERQKVTSELAALGTRLKHVAENTRATVNEDPEHRQRAQALLAEVQESMRQLLDADTEDVKRLTVRKSAVSSALRSISTHKQMLSAYGPHAATRRAGLDRMDETE
jgi:hypothetical protein